MITNNSNVIQILEQPTLDYDVKEITFLSSQEVVNAKELKLTSEGSIYVSNAVMLELVIRGNYKDTEKEKINFTRKIRHVDVDNNAIQTIDYGTFVIMDAEYDNGSETTTLLCYDLMVQTQREYVKEDVAVTFPNTVKNVLSSVVQASGLELDTNTFNNENVVVDVDYWDNASYTYRDVLVHIAQLTTSTIKIKNGKVHVFDIEDTGVTLKDNFVNLKLGEQYGKTNILNISQEPQHDNFFSPANAMDIPVDGRKELVFSNNPILYPEAQEWADTLLPLVSDLEYTTAEFKTYQGGIFEVGDKVKVYAKSTNSYHDVIITKQVYTNTNVQVDLVSSKPFSFKSEHVVETDQKREGQTTYFIVDKQNGIIEGLVNRVDDVEDETARLTIEVDKIETEVKNVHLGNIIPNANAREGYIGWTGDGRTLYTQRMIDVGFEEGFTYGVVAEPKLVQGAMSEYGWDFYSNSGSVYSPVGYVARSGEQYGFRARVDNFKPIQVTVLEYEDIPITTPIKETLYTLSSPQQYVTFEHTMQSNTKYSGLKIKVPTVSFTDRTSLSDIMFNIGQPKDWFESAGDAMSYAQSTRTQLSNQITDVVNEIIIVDNKVVSNKAMIDILSNKIVLMVNSDGKIVQVELSADPVTGSVFAVKADNIELEGYTTINGGFKVLPNGNVEGVNVKLSGEITATSGKIGGYTISGNNLVGNDVTLGNNEITIGDTNIKKMASDTNTVVFEGAGINITGPSKFSSHILFKGQTVLQMLGGAVVGQIDTLSPYVSGYDIGSSSKRYGGIFLQKQPNVSSDSRYKRNILPIDNKLIEIFGKEVEPRTYTMRDNNEIHFGYIAQDVERALYKYTLSKYGLNEAKNVVSEFAVLSKSESYMSLLYGEIAVIMDAYNRRRMDKLEKRIEALEKGMI